MPLGALAELLTDVRGHALRRPRTAPATARPGGAERRARVEHQLNPVEPHLAAVAQHSVQRADRIIAPEADTQSDLHWYSSLSLCTAAACCALRSGRSLELQRSRAAPSIELWRQHDLRRL